VFIKIDDVAADEILVVRRSEIDEVRELVREVELDFDDGIDADALREAAVLYEHVQLLLEMAPAGADERRELEELAGRLQSLLRDVTATAERGASALRGISRSDMRDLHMMLHMSASDGDSVLAMLLAILRRAFRSLFARSA
jgi:hypothetical protein